LSTVHYLAFGSNMLTMRLQARTRSAQPVGTVALHGWRLAFHKRGEDASGKGDLVRAAASERAFGVVYRLATAELPILDRFEGPGYIRTEIEVQLDGRSLACLTYQATASAIDARLEPYDWYRQLILAGLLEHGADAGYIEATRQVPWRRDPIPLRPSRQRALAAVRAFASRYPELASRLATL
jgi:hypothetical protein